MAVFSWASPGKSATGCPFPAAGSIEFHRAWAARTTPWSLLGFGLAISCSSGRKSCAGFCSSQFIGPFPNSRTCSWRKFSVLVYPQMDFICAMLRVINAVCPIQIPFSKSVKMYFPNKPFFGCQPVFLAEPINQGCHWAGLVNGGTWETIHTCADRVHTSAVCVLVPQVCQPANIHL